jgi:hypothetical protein
MKTIIQNFINSDQKELALDYAIPDTVLNILEEFGYIFDDDMNTNGWDHDFWLKTNNSEDKTIVFTGSWYYGKYRLIKE